MPSESSTIPAGGALPGFATACNAPAIEVWDALALSSLTSSLVRALASLISLASSPKVW